MPEHSHTSGKVALITGATGAIGTAIARGLAAMPDFELVLACRDKEKAATVMEDLVQTTANPKVRYELVDVSRRASVQSMANRWRGPLHVLINNAATAPRRRQCTPEDIELQFATNVLGYYWMTELFSEHLSRTSGARIVNVASYWAGDFDIRDLEFRTRPYDNDRAYRQSKQADRMLTAAFARRLRNRGISVNACHPGDVNSRLSHDLGFGGHESPEQGAATPIWLATGDLQDGANGGYFESRRAVSCRFAADVDATEALFAVCRTY